MDTLHLFREAEGGDTYAARDLAHAKELWKADTGQDPDDGTDWQDVPDDRSVTIDVEAPTGKGMTRVTKTASEWAKEMKAPGCCFSLDY